MKKDGIGRMNDTWLKEILKKARAIIKEWHDSRILWKDFPFYIVNTGEGSRAYYRETNNLPIIVANAGWDSEYGSVEIHNGKHFIFLNSIIVSNYIYGDVYSTIIHEILHVIHPNSS